MLELVFGTTLYPCTKIYSDTDLSPTLLFYARNIAAGMMYLAAKVLIHRDLAAMNILVSEDSSCKVRDNLNNLLILWCII